MKKFLSEFLAEFIGTMVLIIGGCGSIILGGDGASHLTVSLAFGLTFLIMYYVMNPITGCHLNPVVTLAMFMTKRLKASEVPVYLTAQFGGAFVGIVILALIMATHGHGFDITGGFAKAGLTANGYGDHFYGKYTWLGAFLTEIVLTFIFVLVYLSVKQTKIPNGLAGIIIGFALTVVHLVGLDVTGTSINPARSLAPALFKGTEALFELWLFFVAPVIGSALAVLTSSKLVPTKEEQ